MRIASRTGSRSTPPERRYPQKFEKAVYAGTMAIFFAAVDVLKVAPLAMLQQFTLPNLITSATLLPLAIAANFLGIWLVRCDRSHHGAAAVVQGGAPNSHSPCGPEAHKHAFQKRGYTPLSINGVHKPWRVHTQHGWHRRKDGENTIRRRDHTQLAHIFQLTRGML